MHIGQRRHLLQHRVVADPHAGRFQLRGKSEQACGQWLTHEADAAKMYPPHAVLPSERQLLRIELEIRAIVADKEIIGRMGLGDDREQGRLAVPLQEGGASENGK